MKTIKIMDIAKKIEELLQENETHQKTIDHLKEKVKSNNRTVGKLRTALTHVGNIIGNEATGGTTVMIEGIKHGES